MALKCLLSMFIFTFCINGYSQQHTPGKVSSEAYVQRLRLPGETRVIKDIQYGQAEGKRLFLDMYIPVNKKGLLPLVVWIHGGGWRSGSKESCRPALELLQYGYAVASISYRLTGIASFPAQIEDCKLAVRFLRGNAEHYGIDPERIGAWGSSAGGHLASMLGTAGEVKEFDRGDYLEFSSKVEAVCNYYGPSSLNDMPARQHLLHFIGGNGENIGERSAKASPLTYVGRNTPPFFIVHGDRDNVVPVSQSQKLHGALLKAGVEAQIHIIKNAGHGGLEFREPELIKKIAAFFGTHL
jgi:acetyl esterase/lipase